MTDDDKKTFASMMRTLHELYKRPEPSRELMQVWFGKLIQFDCDIVSKAFDKWVNDQHNMATPTDIIQLCKAEIERKQLHEVTVKPRANSLLTYQANKKNAEQLKQSIESMTKPKGDFRLWAKRIVKRVENGEKVEMIAEKFAKEALRMEFAE